MNDAGRAYFTVLYIYALQLFAVAGQTLEGFVSHTCAMGQLQRGQMRAGLRQNLQDVIMRRYITF